MRLMVKGGIKMEKIILSNNRISTNLNIMLPRKTSFGNIAFENESSKVSIISRSKIDKAQ